jgi:phosphate starvation-inducible protein PhoH and related proteins
MNNFTITCNVTPAKKQYQAKLNLKSPQVLVCIGPAGSGKTMEACKAALNHIEENHYNKMIITRPSITVEENLGYLPGDINKKMNPSMVPIYEYFDEFSNPQNMNKYMKKGTIELVPLGFMRGRTFDNTIVIADEMQNSTKKQMLNLLTRIGNYSKLIITGDTDQCDIPENQSGLIDLIEKYNDHYHPTFFEYDNESKTKNIDLLQLSHDDIKRSEIVKEILQIYKLL